jgi:hypothetical protein
MPGSGVHLDPTQMCLSKTKSGYPFDPINIMKNAERH